MALAVPSCKLISQESLFVGDNLSLLEEFLHGGITTSELLDRQCGNFIISQTQVVLRTQQRLFGFDEV